MGAGGIVNDKAQALLILAQTPLFGDGGPANKAKVDAVAAKAKNSPTSLDIHDCDTLLAVLKNSVHC